MSTVKNILGKVLPSFVEGYGDVRPFNGAFAEEPSMKRCAPRVKRRLPAGSKVIGNLDDFFHNVKLVDGMTLGFHHHFRNGDGVLNLVLEYAEKLGVKDLTIAISSIFPVHEKLVDCIKKGIVIGIDTNYMSGNLPKEISAGIMKRPVIMRTHGGRARAIECGQLKIDIAFIAAPTVDTYGNINGVMGDTACGSLGYAFPDAEYADVVVAITDNIVDYPLNPISIPQTRVDYVVKVKQIGDPKGIVSGTTKITRDPIGHRIASLAAQAAWASGYLKDGFSFQTGAGGVSLAVAHYIRKIMEKENICGSFALGGITGYLVEMMEQGLFKQIFDVQGFDLEAIRSLRDNPNHIEIGADMYASPFNSGCVVNMLDIVILGATEIDTNFNVNVVTGSDGVIMGGSGGHSDAAAGAKMTVVVANLIRGRLPIVVDEVLTATTPGETVDVLVTEHGLAVNPLRKDLQDKFADARLPVKSIEELKHIAEKMAGKPRKIAVKDRVVALIEYRDGTIIDCVRQI